MVLPAQKTAEVDCTGLLVVNMQSESLAMERIVLRTSPQSTRESHHIWDGLKATSAGFYAARHKLDLFFMLQCRQSNKTFEEKDKEMSEQVQILLSQNDFKDMNIADEYQELLV